MDNNVVIFDYSERRYWVDKDDLLRAGGKVLLPDFNPIAVKLTPNGVGYEAESIPEVDESLALTAAIAGHHDE